MSITVGAVSYKTFKAFYAAACKMAEKKGEKIPSYMTLYMRLRAGKSPATAMAKKIRSYKKKVSENEIQVA